MKVTRAKLIRDDKSDGFSRFSDKYGEREIYGAGLFWRSKTDCQRFVRDLKRNCYVISPIDCTSIIMGLTFGTSRSI